MHAVISSEGGQIPDHSFRSCNVDMVCHLNYLYCSVWPLCTHLALSRTFFSLPILSYSALPSPRKLNKFCVRVSVSCYRETAHAGQTCTYVFSVRVTIAPLYDYHISGHGSYTLTIPLPTCVHHLVLFSFFLRNNNFSCRITSTT